MKKNYFLDTNVLLHDAHSLFHFQDNNVIIPICVIEELDGFKKNADERGRNARLVSRTLDALRQTGALSDGVALSNGGTLRIELNHCSHVKISELIQHKPDNRLLATALNLSEREPHHPTIIVTKDVNLRIKADACGITAEDYENDHTPIEELYTGYAELEVPNETIDLIFERSQIPLEAVARNGGTNGFHPNQFAVLRAPDNTSALARFDFTHQNLALMRNGSRNVWGIGPKNKEQKFAIDLLMNDAIQLVTLVGVAGTGKTLLAIAAGLEKTLEEGKFKKVLITRPVIPVGRDIGYLPGDLHEKLDPWMQPIYDNLAFLTLGHTSSKIEGQKSFGSYETQQYLQDIGMLAVESLTHIRGRSIPHQFIIIDEAQNLTPHEAKTLLTRAGEGTKIVLTGDPYQIDHPYLDASSNGLTYIVERFKDEVIAGHVTLKKGERSGLAEMAARLL